MTTSTVPERVISEGLFPPRLPVLGSLKIGGLKPATVQTSGGKTMQPPVKYDHFKIVTRSRGPDGNYITDQAVHDVVGEKPKELDVRLPFDTRAENFFAQMLYYKGRTQKELSCDGETCVHVPTERPKPCDRRAGRACPCKPYGRLSVILEAAPTSGGLYVYRTTSWETVTTMQTQLKAWEKDFGFLRALPLRLQLYETEVRYKDAGGKEHVGTAMKVALLLRASWEEAQRAALEFHRRHQIARREILQIASGTIEELDAIDAEEEEAFVEEFHPEAAATDAPADTPRAPLDEPAAPSPAARPEPEEDPIDGLIDRLRGLMARAAADGIRITPKNGMKLDAAIAARDPVKLEASIDWLESAKPKTDAQQSLLEG